MPGQCHESCGVRTAKRREQLNIPETLVPETESRKIEVVESFQKDLLKGHPRR